MYTEKIIYKITTHIIFTLIIVTIGGIKLNAQNYNFEHFSLNEGLPQSEVNCITQDRRGYLWVGTRGGGLCKFDGLNFTVFNEKNGISGNIIKSICEDKEGNIWSTSTWGGITKYNGRNFFIFKKNDGLLNDKENNVIICDNTGKLWIGSTLGVTTYYNGKFKRYSKEDNNLLNYDVNCITQDSKKNIWIGGSNGITFISKEDTIFINIDDGLHSNHITTIQEDFNGDILIGSKRKGIIKLLKESINNKKLIFENINSIPSETEIKAIEKGDNKSMWIATNTRGIYILNKNSELVTHYTTTNGLKSNSINTIYKDNLEGMWLGTYNSGLTKHNNKAFLFYDYISGLNSAFIFGITKDKEGNIWVGDSYNGITKYDGKTVTKYSTKNGLPTNKIFVVIKDKKENIWFASDKGLIKYSNNKFKLYTVKDGLPNNRVTSLAIDHNDDLLIGTYGKGICKYNYSNFTALPINDSLSNNRVLSIFEDSKQNIWIGTVNGLNKLKNGKISKYNTELCNSEITDMTEDNYGNIWFATDRCLIKFDGTKFKTITTEDGLSSGVIYIIYTDKKGDIWSGSNNGIDKISLNNYGQIKKIKNYNIKEGFKGVECNSRGIYEDEKSNLYIATIKGLIQYNPNEDKYNIFEPSIYIDNIKLFFEDVNWHNYSNDLRKWDNLPKKLTLNHNENHLTFEFSAINLSYPEGIHYSFKLEPFDEDWYELSEKKPATYSNLPPGDYTFHVKAKNSNGTWNKNPATYSFSIASPIWKRWWFYFLIIILIFYIGYKISSYKERNQVEISKQLEKKVKERTALIEAQRDEKEILLKEIHHRVKNNLQVINSLLSIQSSYTKDKKALSLFDEAKNRIRSMALIHEKMYQSGDLAHIDFQEYITILVEDLIRTYSINCEISLDLKIEKMKFDIDTLIPIGLLLNEILSNSLKYAFKNKKRGEIIVYLSKRSKENEFILTVGDNGVGVTDEIFESEEGTLGMELIKVFVSQLDGSIKKLQKSGTIYEIIFYSLQK